MLARRPFALAVVAVAILQMPLLISCGATPTPTAVPTKPAATAAATAAPTLVPPTKVPSTATPVPPTPTVGPTVGGNVVFALDGEPDTLDIQKSAMGLMSVIMEQVDGSLVIREPGTGKIVPYLADSWKISDDGLTIDFKLHPGVKFHDGSPMTAADWAWTLNRAIDPETKSPGTGQFLAALAKAEAIDDLTLRLTLAAPNFPLLVNLSLRSYCGVLSKAAVEKAGDAYGRNPIGVGPYKFKEWQTGTRIVVERNPDYSWGPAFAHKGAAYVQTIEFRFIPEYSTVAAGLESGELDLYERVVAKDVQRLKDSKKVTFIEYTIQGMGPYLSVNCSMYPFDDVKVRQALNYAVDRTIMIKTAALGYAVEQHGPLSPSVSGYWSGAEQIGYNYNPDKAKALLKEAGWTAGADGILVKDGKPFKVTINQWPDPVYDKVAQIAQEEWKAVGIQADIIQVEQATLINQAISGEVGCAVFGYGWPDADILVLVFGSNAIGGMSLAKVNDDELDRLLVLTRTTMDATKRQEAVNNVVKRIVDQAYAIPLYAPNGFYAVNVRVKGVNMSPSTLDLWLNDAFIQK